MERFLNTKKVRSLACIFCIYTALLAQSPKGFSFLENSDQNQIEIRYNDRILTAYVYNESNKKPILFPVNTVDGITVTRSYPIKNIPGERTDHPHHTGIWLNYESVNGLDFWNNSTAIPDDRKNRYGTIVHTGIKKTVHKKNKATLETTAKWQRPDTKIILDESTIYYFTVKHNDFIIDRITTLTAKDSQVLFKDVKDGMFAIRVARELELPSKEKSNFIDIHGNVTSVDPSAEDVQGMYYSSTGLQGEKVWGTKGPWMMLTGKKQGKDITIAIVDHPSNPGYPAYWHARGYGLFAVNPLGRKIFSNGSEELNLSVDPNKSVTFRYRVIVRSGKMFTREEMDKIQKEFGSHPY